MRGKLSKILSLAVVGTMVAGMVGCSSGGSKSTTATTTTTDKKDLLKLDVFSMTANFAGTQPGWFAKVIKDKFNIQLNIIAPNLQGGDAKYATAMVAGNLGDIVVFGQDDVKYTNAIKAGVLLDWNKDGLLTKYGKDISTYPKAIVKAKTNFGKGTAVYGLGHGVSTMPSTSPSEGNTMSYGSDLRWDLYQKIGSPKMKTMEDLLPVLKKMQALEPKSDSGKPTYAFSMWPDWDGNMMMNAKNFATMQGYDELGFLLVNANQEKYQSILDPTGYYMRTLKLYYDANKMGLVDPDSISQKYDNANAKLIDGQALFSWFPFMDVHYNTPARTSVGKGFEFVPFSDESIYSNGFANYGANQIMSIGAKTKEPARVMELVNWLYSSEGIMTSNYGPKGLAWDLKDGKPYETAFGKTALPSNDVPVPAAYGGGSWKDGANQMNYANVNVNSINPDTKEPYNFAMWKSTIADSSKVDKNWQATMKATTAKDYVVKNKMISVAPVTMFSAASPDSSTMQKQNQIKTVILQDSWKMVFAKNDSEYAALQKDMITKSKGLGYDDVLKFWVTQAEKTFAARKTAK